MPINIIIAKTAQQIDEVFKIRHKVFVEEEGLIAAQADKRLMDRFDAFPSTKNLIVTLDNEIIGAFRMSLDSELGVPADEYFNFRDYLPNESSVLHCGMFCVLKEYRSPRVTSDLMLMASYYAISNNVSHVLAPINPQIARLLQRVGFEVLGDEFLDPHLNTNVLPLMMQAHKLNDFFLNFVQKNQLQDFLGDYERSFYAKNELVIEAGTIGKHAFVIISGEASVRLPNTQEAIAVLKEGEVFGELALLTDETRSADIIASTDLQVMTLSKEVFVEYFYNHPKQAQQLLKLMGQRTRKLIAQLQELS